MKPQYANRVSVFVVFVVVFVGLIGIGPAAGVHDEYEDETLLIPWHHDGESFAAVVGQPFEVGARWGACTEALANEFRSLPDLTVDLSVVGPVHGAAWPQVDWLAPIQPAGTGKKQ